MSLVSVRPLADLRARRASIKWRRFPDDVLPLFVAEMDFELAPAVAAAVTDAVAKSDTGYLDDVIARPLFDAFARFADAEWGWRVDPAQVHLATDVTVGMLEALRLVVPASGGRVVLTPPVYPPFFEMVSEAHAEVVEVPLAEADGWALDLPGLERAFAAGVEAMFLCNPQNPTGRVHSRASLVALAALAARYDVVVLSDEVHAPLTHPGAVFTPFGPIAAAAGARSATVTSPSKAWNLAALKCAVVVGNDAAMAERLRHVPEELAARTSILGMHASIAAFDCTDWRDAAVEWIVANLRLLESELAAHAPLVRVVPADAGYLVWLDLRATGLGDDPGAVLIETGRVAFNRGVFFGTGGAGFVRLNLACEPETIVEAVRRIARTLELVGQASAPAGA